MGRWMALGFVTTDGAGTMIYYDGSDLPYYYALADNFTLGGNYFCSLLGPTDPNRLYLWTATSGVKKLFRFH
jgi:phospholipase C